MDFVDARSDGLHGVCNLKSANVEWLGKRSISLRTSGSSRNLLSSLAHLVMQVCSASGNI